MSQPAESYADVWDEVYEDPVLCRKAGLWFIGQFPDGHRTSIKPLARNILHDPSILKGGETEDKCQFDGEALKLLLDYGVDYTPTLKQQNTFRFADREPEFGQCFSNAFTYLKESSQEAPKRVYVEGLVCGYLIGTALHAWNATTLYDTTAIDWSCYIGCEWNRYLGIPFTSDEYSTLQALIWPGDPTISISLFDIMFFPYLKKYILKILASRKVPVS